MIRMLQLAVLALALIFQALPTLTPTTQARTETPKAITLAAANN